ncbi:MAG TPA: hypothetical protein PK313_01365 [Myxococcota bacterium]|nr:hypothetical protein [Myxococcota bacterium]
MHRFTCTHDPDLGLDIVASPRWRLVVRRRGAEVIGLRRRDPRGDVGLIWRDGEPGDPPRFWKGHATLLFPIVGGLHDHRSRTTDGIPVSFAGLHGFVRHRVLERVVAEPRGDAFVLGYRLAADAETRAMYPWDFVFEVTYTLTDAGLATDIAVASRDARPMPYQVGWHPGFALPFRAGTGSKAGCHLNLPPRPLTFLDNDDDCKLTGTARVVDGRGDFAFTERGLDRTYMLDLSDVPPAERTVELLDPDRAFGVRVTFPDYPHLGLWSDADAPFLCIEPWQGMDDRAVQEPFDRKFGVALLAPGATETRRAAVAVIDRRP